MDNYNILKHISKVLKSDKSAQNKFNSVSSSELNKQQIDRLNFLNELRAGRISSVPFKDQQITAEESLSQIKQVDSRKLFLPKTAIAAILLFFLLTVGTFSAEATNSLPTSFQTAIAHVFSHVGIHFPVSTTVPPSRSTSKPGSSKPNCNPNGKCSNSRSHSTSNGSSKLHSSNNANKSNSIQSNSSNNQRGQPSQVPPTNNSTSSSTAGSSPCINPSQGSAHGQGSTHSSQATIVNGSIPGNKCNTPAATS